MICENNYHVSLFSGIGGLDIAAEAAGFKTVLQVEKDEKARAVLRKHWPNVKRLVDVRDIPFYQFPKLKSCAVLSGGFPCQPYSVVGKRRGAQDERALWGYFNDAIRVLQPIFVVAENVPGSLSLVGAEVVSCMEAGGYWAQVYCLEAAAFGAPQRRERCFYIGAREDWITTHAESVRQTMLPCATVPAKEAVSDALAGIRRSNVRLWDSPPRVDRVANGLPDWVDRYKQLGNAVVPAQAYPIFWAIAKILGVSA